MAYMNQERKKMLVEQVKPILKSYGVKGSFSVRNHSTLVLTITEGKLDLMENHYATYEPRHTSFSNGRPLEKSYYMSVNPYWLSENHSGICLEFLEKVKTAMNLGNHDRSDIMSDYFDVGWYIDVNIGTYKKPYKVLS